MNSASQLPPALSYSIPRLVAATGWSRSLVYTLIASGRLQTFKVGKRRFVTAKAATDCLRQLEAENLIERPRATPAVRAATYHR